MGWFRVQMNRFTRVFFGQRIAIISISLVAIIFAAALSQRVFSLLDDGAEPSVWFAEHKRISRIDGTNGVIDKSIPVPYEVTDLAIDQADYSVWVLMHQHLLKISSNTNIIFEKSLKDEINISDPRQIEIDPYRGNVWIASNKSVVAMDRSANFLNQINFDKPVVDFTINPDGGITALSDEKLHAFTKTGNAISSLSTASYIDKPLYLETDWLNSIQWLASKNKVVAIASGTGGFSKKEYAVTDASGIQDIQQDILTGKLWVATNSYLRAYSGRKTSPVAQIKIPDRFKSAEQLAVGTVGKSLWVGTKKDVIQFNETGQILTETKVENEFEALTTTSYAPVPQIQFISLPALTSSPIPNVDLLLGASCGLHDCVLSETWYQSLSIDSTLNGRQIGREYTINGNIARYIPPVRLPEGENHASAMVTDVYGNASSFVPYKFVVDTIPPRFIKFIPADGTKLQNPEIVIEGSVDDAQAVIALENMANIGGEVVRSNPLDFAFKVPLNIGINTFTFSAIDPAGNRSQTAFTITRTANLELSILSPKDGDVINGNRVDVTGSVSGIAGVMVKVNGIDADIQPDSTYIAQGIPLTAGLNKIEVIATTSWGGELARSINVYAGSGGWGQPVLVGTNWSDFSVAKFMGCGNGMALWTQGEAVPGRQPSSPYTNGKVWVSHFSTGGGWSQSYSVDDRRIYGSAGPAIDTTNNGELALVFGTPDDLHDLTARRFTLGNEWSNIGMPHTGVPGASTFPAVAATSQAGVQVLWTAWPQTWYRYNDVYARQYQSGFSDEYDPAKWTAVEKLEAPRSDRLDELYPAIAKNEQGDAIAVWWRRAWWEWGYEVVASIYKNGVWSEHEVISTGKLEANPNVTIDRNGNAMVVWEQLPGPYYGGNYEIMVRRYSADNGWSDAIRLNKNNSAGVHSGEPAISGNENGVVQAVWLEDGVVTAAELQYRSLYGYLWGKSIWTARYDPQTGWSEPTQIAAVDPDHTSINLSSPTVAINESGKAVAAWYNAGAVLENGNWVLVNKFKATRFDGSSWEEPYVVGDGSPGHEGYTASVDMDDCDNIIASWQLNTHNDSGQRFSQVVVNSYSTVVEGAKPTVVAPPAITLEATAVLTPVQLGEANATDPFDGQLTATPNKSGPFPLGTTLVTWSATNSKGVTANDLQVVTITDTTPPGLTIPADILVEISEPTGIPATINLGDAHAVDIFEPVQVGKSYNGKFDIGVHKVTWTATDANGNQTTAIQTVEVVYTGSLYIRIDTPQNGSSLDNNQAMISGRLLAPINTGVTVNGVVAEVYNGNFYANNVPLEVGSNEITAVATTLHGETLSHSISINSEKANQYIVKPVPTAGLAPLTVSFDVEAWAGSPVSRISIDFGDYTPSSSTIFAEERLTHTYASPGAYTAKVTIDAEDGSSHDRIVYIVVHDPEEQDKLFKSIWDGMNQELVAGQVGEALKYLTSEVRFKYSAVFETLLSEMPQIVESYSPLYRGNVSDTIGEYVLVRPYESEKRVYLIYFLRNYDGVWRVSSM